MMRWLLHAPRLPRQLAQRSRWRCASKEILHTRCLLPAGASKSKNSLFPGHPRAHLGRTQQSPICSRHGASQPSRQIAHHPLTVRQWNLRTAPSMRLLRRRRSHAADPEAGAEPATDIHRLRAALLSSFCVSPSASQRLHECETRLLFFGMSPGGNPRLGPVAL